MRQEEIDALGGDAFAQLVSLLRPVTRRQAGADSVAEAQPTPAPAQRIEMRLSCEGERVRANLQLWLRAPADQALVVVWVLPLSEGAVVEGLRLQRASQSDEPGGLCERREARNWFDLARRSGLPGALLSEDAPGVFSLEIASPAGGALRASLDYEYRRPAGENREITVRCEAAAGSVPIGSGRARVLRLGSGRRLDRLAGITAGPAAEAAFGAAPPRRGGETRPAVFASYDRDGISSAMFRGAIAGRQVRLWAELSEPAAVDLAAGAPRDGELNRLMAQYRQPERTEAERRVLAAEVARLGIEAGRTTLWTSFVAVASGEGPGGEMVFAAA